MKKTFFAIIALGTVVINTSCKKSDTNNNSNTGGSFTFMVDGVKVTADSATATLYTLGVPPFNRMIDVFVFQGSSVSGGITIPNQIMEMHFLPKAGAQTVSATFANAWLTYSTYAAGNPVPTNSYDGTAGAFNLSVCDTVGKKLTGTFNFTGTATVGSGTKTITEGNLIVNTMIIQ